MYDFSFLKSTSIKTFYLKFGVIFCDSFSHNDSSFKFYLNFRIALQRYPRYESQENASLYSTILISVGDLIHCDRFKSLREITIWYHAVSDHKMFEMHNKFFMIFQASFKLMKPSYLITNAGLMVKGSSQACIEKTFGTF